MGCSVLALVFCPGNKLSWILFWPLHHGCVQEKRSWCGSSGSPHGAVLTSLPPFPSFPVTSEPLRIKETEDGGSAKGDTISCPWESCPKDWPFMVYPRPSPTPKVQSGFVTKLVYFSGKLQLCLSLWKWFLSRMARISLAPCCPRR